MFETALLSTGPQTKRVWTTFLGFTGQAMLLTGLVLVPLICPQALPRVAWAISLAPPPSPPPPPLAPRVMPIARLRATRVFTGFVAPASVPPRVLPIDDLADLPPAREGVPGAVPTGVQLGDRNGIPGGIGIPEFAVRPPRPPQPVVRDVPPPPTPPAPQRITVLQMAEPIQRITPTYPPLARAAHISGKVDLMGVLGTDGRIHEIKVISGHPMLVRAAVDAVMQWVYRPTILNGQPVEVQAPIVVNFILN